MAEQMNDIDEVTTESQKFELQIKQILQERIKENLGEIKKIFDRFNTGEVQGKEEEDLQLMATFLLRTTAQMEVELERISKRDDELEKRPADLTAENVPVLLMPLDNAPNQVRGIMDKLHNSALEESEVIIIKQLCESAAFALSQMPEELYDLNGMAKFIKVPYGKLLLARRMLVFLKGYELPAFTAKKIDEKDPKEVDTQVDYQIWVAHEGIKKAIEWCDIESTEPDADAKRLVKGLDQALNAIAHVDALVKGLEDSAEREEK